MFGCFEGFSIALATMALLSPSVFAPGVFAGLISTSVFSVY